MNIAKILEEHKKWLSDEGGERANLQGANLQGADLQGANLQGVNLRRANLQYANLQYAGLQYADLQGADLQGAKLRGADLLGADLDYSVVNLSCNDLQQHLDDKLLIQRLYHLLSNVKFSKHTSDRLKKILLTEELKELANDFHRVKECGKI